MFWIIVIVMKIIVIVVVLNEKCRRVIIEKIMFLSCMRRLNIVLIVFLV